jgi:hypothetical protein
MSSIFLFFFSPYFSWSITFSSLFIVIFLAQMEMEILCSKVVFFIAQKERPEEVPFWAYKKQFYKKDCNVQLD